MNGENAVKRSKLINICWKLCSKSEFNVGRRKALWKAVTAEKALHTTFSIMKIEEKPSNDAPDILPKEDISHNDLFSIKLIFSSFRISNKLNTCDSKSYPWSQRKSNEKTKKNCSICGNLITSPYTFAFQLPFSSRTILIICTPNTAQHSQPHILSVSIWRASSTEKSTSVLTTRSNQPASIGLSLLWR